MKQVRDCARSLQRIARDNDTTVVAAGREMIRALEESMTIVMMAMVFEDFEPFMRMDEGESDDEEKGAGTGR